MNTPLFYTVISFAPIEINKKFLQVKKRFNELTDANKKIEDIHSSKHTAHVTLKRMFALKENITEEQIATALDNIQLSPIKIFSNELKIFHSEREGTILIAVINNSPQLQALHKQISNAIDPFIEINPQYEIQKFIPHISILYNIPDNLLDQSIEYAQKQLLPTSFTLDTMSFVKDTSVTQENGFIKTYQAIQPK